MPLSIQKLAANNYIAVDLEINNVTMLLPIQKLAIKNYIVVDSEIGSDGGVISGFNLLFFVCLH